MARTDHESSPPDVSVVIPTHDRSRLLQLTLRSILRQRDVAFEVIVVDDGSTDDTPEVVHDLRDPRVRLIRRDSAAGVSAARNTGITHARGEWLAFCDDDDLWAPEKLAKQLEAAANSEGSWVCAGHVDINPRLRVVGGAPPPSSEEIVRLLPFRNVVPGGGSGVIVRRNTLDLVGGFDTRLRNTEDWELWLRLADQGPPGLVAEPLVAYRIHPGGGSLDDAAMLQDVATIERIHGIQVSRAALHRYMGWWALRGGRRGAALRHLLVALRHADELSPRGDLAFDLSYLIRDSLLAVPTRGRRRARPWGREPETVVTWRRSAQVWVDRLAESAGGEEMASSHA